MVHFNMVIADVQINSEGIETGLEVIYACKALF